ncbi:hypothetical protein LTR95_000332 [Oleoguttula sp. CCFEE 5521]
MASRQRRMTLPSTPGRAEPIHKPAQKTLSDPAHGAAFIFVHGLGDTAEGLEDVADQFQNNNKLPHMHWIIPNALENRDAMTTAWYTPTQLSPFANDRPELDDPEDEEGMMNSVKYLESLIDACGKKGIPPQRVVLGGFSQGCAMSLLTDLTSSKYAGRLAGIIGLMGYLPLCNRLPDMRAKAGLPVTHGDVPIMLARGQKDTLIPKRVWNITLKQLEFLGVGSDDLIVKEYEGLGHSLNGAVMKDMCAFLERVVPSLED